MSSRSVTSSTRGAVAEKRRGRRRSSILPDGRRSSWIALENGAGDTQSIRSSVVGRLGGSISSSSAALTEVDLQSIIAGYDENSEEIDERTSFVTAASLRSTTTPPRLMVWIFPAVACALCYSLYNIFIKKASANIHPILGGVILQFVAAFVGTAFLIFLLVKERHDKPDVAYIEYDRNGFIWAGIAGLAVGIAEMLSFCVSGMGVPAMQSIPIIIGGSVVVGAVLGSVLLGETMMLRGWSGIVLVVGGIALVSTDNNSTGTTILSETVVEQDKEPALYLWIGPALLCASAYAMYNISIKKGSTHLTPILGGVILQFVAAIFGTMSLGIMAFIKHGSGKNTEDSADPVWLHWNATGIVWACAAGLAVGCAELLSFVVSGFGVPATQSIPTIIGGSVAAGAVLGFLWLEETLLLPGWSGVVLLVLGIGLVATDVA